MAALHLADAQFEELLALEVPAHLTFADRPGDPKQQRAREDSLRRLSEFLARTRALAQTLEGQYNEIAATRTSPAATIAALTRLAQLAEYHAAIFLLADLPAEIRDPPAVAAYCQAMRAHTEPMLAVAVAAHARSLELPTTTGQFTDFSRLSEATLQILPIDHGLLEPADLVAAHGGEREQLDRPGGPLLDEPITTSRHRQPFANHRVERAPLLRCQEALVGPSHRPCSAQKTPSSPSGAPAAGNRAGPSR